MNRHQLSQELQKAEEHLASLRKQLEKRKFPTIQEASVRDVLEDGSIVLIKEKNHAIVVCSKDREFDSTWNNLEKNKIKAGFGPEWFIPSKKLLVLAYQRIPEHFSRRWYWSSSECNASSACVVSFIAGKRYSFNKSGTCCVRSVRCIVF